MQFFYKVLDFQILNKNSKIKFSKQIFFKLIMNRTSIRQSDVNEYIKTTKLIPCSNPLKQPSPDKLTGKEQISSTENPIRFF